MRSIFTSESVTEGHPDKICDQISDAILDELLEQDPRSRVAVETFTTTGMILIAGEVRTEGYADAQRIARETLQRIGYTDPVFGIDCRDAAVLTAIHEQSPDIAQGVDGTDEEHLGAGDQGIMFGYACNETQELMPLPIMLAHRLAQRLADVRKSGKLDYLGPDGKTQVSVEYDDTTPVRIDSVVISSQHREHVPIERVREDLRREVADVVLQDRVDAQTRYHINPTGKFVIGGPEADSGLTGRKIIVDTYGGSARHGGGAFSGKDATKVDRSASYAARYVAKNIVAAGIAERCEVQLSYAIGVTEPVSIRVETFGTSAYPDDLILEAIRSVFDLTPSGIIRDLSLRQPIFRQTSVYGHFGRETFAWERCDRIDALKARVARGPVISRTPRDPHSSDRSR